MKQGLILSIIALSFFSACKQKEEPKNESKKFTLSDSMQHMITIDTIRMCNIADELTLSGEVSFNENNVIKVVPRSSGQVIECKVTLGDKISKGQVLAVIRSADIAGSYSDVSSANADVAIAKRQMDNTESLYKSGISSEKEYIEAKQNYQKALAVQNKANVTLKINGGSKTTSGGQYSITSPIDGYIVEKKVNVGSYIRQDMGDNLFTISDLKNVWIYANVYEADISKVRENYSVRVIPMSYPDKVYSGKIDKVSQVLDPQSKAMKVRIALDNKDMLLKPDMFAKVIVSNEEGVKAVCVPTKALISQDSKNYVVVYNSNSDLHVSQVDVIKTVNDRTYVNSGVEVGQKVVTKDQLLIFNQLLNE